MFCASGLVFGGAEGVRSRFHRLIPFSYFPLPDMFLAIPRASGPVVMFYAPGLVYGGTEGVGLVFMFCATGLIFEGTEGVPTRFHVLRSQTSF
jgi:hypothetical protein